MHTVSPLSLLLILLIVLVLFGSKRLRNIGGDLGAAFRSFQRGMHETDDLPPSTNTPDPEGQDKKPFN